MINFLKRKFKREEVFPIVIIILYFSIVFYNFFAQGIINVDEAALVLVTHTYSDISKTFLFHPSKIFSSDYYRNLIENYGNIYTAGRPLYVLLASCLDIIWKSEYSTRLLNVLIGAFIIIIFYKILDFYQINLKVKIISSILFIASPLFLIYSRLGLSQILSALLLMIVIFYLLKLLKHFQLKYLILSGISTALLFMSHYITLPLVLVLFFYSISLLYKNRAKIFYYLAYFLSFIVPLLTWEAITRLGVFLARTRELGEASQKVVSYSGELLKQLTYGQGLKSFILDQEIFYLKLLLSSENLIIIILLTLGIIFAIKNIKQRKHNLIVSLFLIFFVFNSMLCLKFPRNIIPILPLFYLLSALGLQQIYSNLKKVVNEEKVYIVLLGLLTMVIVFNINNYLNIFNIKTNADKISVFIRDSFEPEDVQIVSPSAAIWRVYLPGYKIDPVSKFNLKKLDEKDKKILLISDHYAKIDDSQIFKSYQEKLLVRYPTNIFRVKPIILDLFCRDRDYTEKLFINNFNSTTEVYQIKI